MLKKLRCLLVAMLSGCFLAGCSHTSEAPLCGGVVDRSDHSAPKAIASKEMTSFSSSFWRYDEDSPEQGARRWRISAAKDGAGRSWIEINGDKAKIQGDDALLAEIQEVIDRFGLVKLNGVDRFTSGLPPQYGPTSLNAEYASGERLYFQINGDPGSPWTAALLEIFLSRKLLDDASGRNAR